jgi:hypothetical protein
VLYACNLPSPIATASLDIAKYVVDTVVTHAGDRLTSPVSIGNGLA